MERARVNELSLTWKWKYQRARGVEWQPLILDWRVFRGQQYWTLLSLEEDMVSKVVAALCKTEQGIWVVDRRVLDRAKGRGFLSRR